VKKIFFLSVLTITSFYSQAQKITGSWQGVLIAGPQKLKVVFHVLRDSLNVYHSSFDSPDQNAFGIACSETNIKSDSLEMLIQAIHGGYRGKWDGKNNISGYYFQAGQNFPLGLTRLPDSAVSLVRPQTPKPPFPYHSEDIEYDNPVNGIHYAGTITYPNSGAPFPAVLLITGSGQEDRDETVFGHKPFAVIADFLTRRGFAVLRVDDRQKGKSTGDLSKATTLDFSKDVGTSLGELQKRKEVDQNKIGLIGHSEGGLIAAMVAAENPKIRFIILLAGPGLKGADLLSLQTKAIDLTMGIPEEMATADQELKSQMIKALLSSRDTSVQFENAWKSFLTWKKNTNPEIVSAVGINSDIAARDFIRSYLSGLNNPWLLYFLQTDPADYLVKLKCRVLALNGSKDIQVLADPNLAAIDSALKKSGVTIYSTQKLNGLNHLFQHCKTCTITEYGQLEETFSPEVLQIMGDWLDKNVK
jgi:pimeloyl-ACP methyl ester carboxylesterase